SVKYCGYLKNSTKPFSSNWNSKYPKLMKLGRDITLWGLELGLLSMAKGELAWFIFVPKYAYGQMGCPPCIPPNTTVLFLVLLLDFIDSKESDAFLELTNEQRDTFPLQKVLKVATVEREFGNYFFNMQHFRIAKDRYKKALSILDRSPSSEAELKQINTSKVLLLLNLSLTYLRLERPDQALKYGERALELDQGNAKALFRCGQASLCLGEYSKSWDFLIRAQKIQPLDKNINKELEKLAR
ncbi:Peptidyl-prolyl cis-trans isomerase FKBP6, partial [Acanthisitta chloris]